MKFLIHNKIKLNNVIQEAIKMLLNGSLHIEVINVSKPKTKKQLGFVWGWIIDDIYQEYVKNGHFINEKETRAKEKIKTMLYHECSNSEKIICPMTGKVYNELIRMSSMDIKEMSLFITSVIDWCDDIGIILRPESRYCWINSLTDDMMNESLSIHFPERDEGYLRYIRKSYCLISGEFGCDAHHVKLNEAGLGDTSPDWCTLPIAHKYHVRQSGHITTAEIEQLCKPIFQGLDIKTFCKLNYWKYKTHR